MDSKSIYLTPFKGRLTAFNLFESLKVGNLLSILLLLNWWQYSYLHFLTTGYPEGLSTSI